MKDTIFFDGSCGLCHRAVRFAVSLDRSGVFQFAPIGGAFFAASFAEEERPEIPDSLIVQTIDRRILVRSAAMLYIGKQLGGLWKALAVSCTVVPTVIADRIYDFVASIRSRLFARPKESCPIVPEALKSRFLD